MTNTKTTTLLLSRSFALITFKRELILSCYISCHFHCISTWSYENRVSKHLVIFLNFPCLIACLLCCLLMSFVCLFAFFSLFCGEGNIVLYSLFIWLNGSITLIRAETERYDIGRFSKVTAKSLASRTGS